MFKEKLLKKKKRQRDNQPYGRFYQYLKENLFETHPYKFPIIGFIEDLDSSSLEDFKDFKEKFYSPSNAVFVIAGDIDIDETKKASLILF
jgi:zinc protease